MITPCVRICVMNHETGYCEGCGRTIDEIASWSSLTDEARREIMELLPARLAANAEAEFTPPAAPASPGDWRSR